MPCPKPNIPLVSGIVPGFKLVTLPVNPVPTSFLAVSPHFLPSFSLYCSLYSLRNFPSYVTHFEEADVAALVPA